MTCVDPRVAVSAGIGAVYNELDSARAAIEALAYLYESNRDPVSSDAGSTYILSDAGEIASWYTQLFVQAKSEFRAFDRPPYVSVPMEDMESHSLRDGVIVRAVYTEASLKRPGAVQEIQRLAELGEMPRIMRDSPPSSQLQTTWRPLFR